MAKTLPNYASGIPSDLLILVHCRNVACGSTRRAYYAKLSRPDWKKSGMTMGSITATCLKCGEVASDFYNWRRP